MRSDHLFDLEDEPAAMRQRYGHTEFGQQCLLARRLLEAGVPMVKVARGFWDSHHDNILYGESNGWRADAVRDGALTLTVTEVNDRQLSMRLKGFAKVGQSFETVQRLHRIHSSHGYEPKLLGKLIFDRQNRAFTRFDMVAVGDFYGKLYGNNRNYFRSGRTPLGVAFHLVAETSPTADRMAV